MCREFTQTLVGEVRATVRKRAFFQEGEDGASDFLKDFVAFGDRGHNMQLALVQLNGDNFLFYNKSLGDLNVEKFTYKHPRSIDGVNDVWHAYPHSSRNLHDIGIARKLDWHLYKRLF